MLIVNERLEMNEIMKRGLIELFEVEDEEVIVDQ
jgi:hypothetical protein